jgi:hypothetical protein
LRPAPIYLLLLLRRGCYEPGIKPLLYSKPTQYYLSNAAPF